MDKEFQPTTEENKENHPSMDCVESKEEDISESFICCVCLDLLYKPIVLACGHVSCFWCVHMSMNGYGVSRCPICRHSYHHFPTICQMLHFLIVKMYPSAYQRRDKQMLEYEKKRNYFSPQLEGSSLKSNSFGGSAFTSVPCSKSSLSTEFSKLETPECLQDGKMAVSEENNQSETNTNVTMNQIAITDVLCPTCKELLFRPTVLNCGHVYCETCITIPEDGTISCPICEIPHPSDFPKACLELNNFLGETFPKEYSSRRGSIERDRVDFKQKNSPSCSSSKTSASKSAYLSSFPSGNILHWLTEHGSKVHFGFGCDYCGIYPVVGKRYRCEDCREAIGFDLCGECYDTKSKLPGRFNQQHTAEHKFVLIETSDRAKRLMTRPRLVTGSLDHGPVLLSEVREDSDDGSATLEFSDSPQDNTNSNAEDSTESNNNSTSDL